MHKKLPLFFLSLVLVLIIINIQINPVFATVIFSDGFETGNFNAWTGTDVKAGSTATVVNTTKHHGTYSAQSYCLSGGWAEFYKDPLSSSLNTGYFRTYVRFANLPTTGNRVYFHVTELSATRKVGVIVRNNAGQLQWGLWYYNAGQLEAYVNAIISVDTWYCVEVKHLRHASAGEARLYVDGSEIITQTGLAVDTAMSDLWEGIYDAVGQAYTIFFDCVVVADTYIGPEGQTYVSDLSQSISSTWNLLTQTNFRIIPTQSVTTTWQTLTQWNAILDVSQSIATSWDVLINYNTFVDLSQSIGSTWQVLAQWNATADLSQTITSSWIIDIVLTLAGGIAYTADLSQAISTTFSTILEWDAILDLTQSISTTWTIITQTTFNIEPSLSLTTTWIVDIIQGFQYTVDLTLGITFTWAIDIVYAIGEVATGIGIAFLALILALTAIAIGLLYSRR